MTSINVKALYEAAVNHDSVSWPLCPLQGITFTEHKLSFVDILMLASEGLIPRRGFMEREALHVYTGAEVQNIIECLPEYKLRLITWDAEEPHNEPGGYSGVLNAIWRIYPAHADLNPRDFLVARGEVACRGQITGNFEL